MSDLRDGWKTQLASDIDRDGMGLELPDPSDAVVAEIFRSDRGKTVIVTTFNNDMPVEIFDLQYREALSRLDPFRGRRVVLFRRCPAGSGALCVGLRLTRRCS